MKKTLRKFMAISSVLILILSMIATAYASSYWTSYQFSVSVTGASRSFDGTNIRFISPNATSTPYIHPINKTYTVALYRDKFIDDYIGSVTLTRDYSGTAKWSNVWAGNYYFFLSKANDGITLVDNNVTIQNY